MGEVSSAVKSYPETLKMSVTKQEIFVIWVPKLDFRNKLSSLKHGRKRKLMCIEIISQLHFIQLIGFTVHYAHICC